MSSCCEHKIQWHPQSEDWGVCSDCGAEWVVDEESGEGHIVEVAALHGSGSEVVGDE